ncbi:MAG: thioredoxin domain-containing protein [Mariniblastus sp.]|nr:thioredoxin domain-containing protein [Mariniblastus sp.]
MSNRLVSESSPYLLQHAENPVDWYPWGQEALQKAREEDRPIFLSIGYSACHWCHVMEHESFEDLEIAQLLNDHFVCIKVDREERPDLDQVYMNAVMSIRGGGGGWPLSAFLTPSQQVFFGGTYWPPRSRMNMPGFDRVLNGVLDAFRNRREEVEAQSRQVSDWLNRAETVDDSARISAAPLQSAIYALHGNFDPDHGGFGSAPKFPHPMDLELLIRLSRRWPGELPPGRPTILEMVEVSLNKMAQGGIFDHLAGGFARYSVDEHWLVPHFEKMLYDNALLASVYVEMYQETGDVSHADVARKTLDYLLKGMRDQQGGFFSTEDADSEGEEGKFYVWSRDEIIDCQGAETGERFCRAYNVTEAGNFEGKNILNLSRPLEVMAEKMGVEKEGFLAEMEAAREKLLEVRNRRVRPGLDDKILVSWNALAISALARASLALDEATGKPYLEAGQEAARFLLDHLVDERGRLLHTYRHGHAKLDGYLDDYAYFVVALLDLYRASFDENWIEQAVSIARLMVRHFQGANGFYFTADDQERLIARSKSFQDSSVPSGNAMAALGLLQLGRLLGDPEWTDWAESIVRGSMPLMERSPLASGQMLVVLQRILEPSVELVFFGSRREEFAQLEGLLRAQKLDSLSLICRSPEDAFHSELIDQVTAGKQMVEGRPTLYICQQHACQAPVVGWEEIAESVGQLENAPLQLAGR